MVNEGETDIFDNDEKYFLITVLYYTYIFYLILSALVVEINLRTYNACF